jgi:CDP-6-deoxy-D-xylo-4-hexulose-3-dehydrase
MSEEELRSKIAELVRQFYLESKKSGNFVPGKSKIHYAGRVYDEKEMVSLVNSALDFWLTMGPRAAEFEKKFSGYLGRKHAVLTNSGSSANLLAVSSLMSRQMKNHLRKGDEVITPASTFPTTFNPIIQNGLKPVVVDCELGTYNASAESIEKALSEKTRLIVVPHTLGNPCEMDAIMEIAEGRGIRVIEDTCDALDSKYNGKLCGTFGTMGTFSFFPAHHITLGEGGAVITDEDELATALRSMRDWGRSCTCPVCKLTLDPDYDCPLLRDIKTEGLPEDYDRRYTYMNIGYNLKTLDLNAAIGIEQLKKLPSFTEARKRNFRLLYESLLPYEKFFVLPKALPKADPSWFAFPLTVRDSAPFKRKDIMAHLTSANIECKLLFTGNILKHPAYRNVECRVAEPLANSDAVMRSSFFLGVYPGIDNERMAYMIGALETFLKKF